MKKFKLNLKTPEKTVFSDDVNSVSVSTVKGRMTILAGHVDLTGNIIFSDVVVKKDGEEKEYYVRNGIVFIDKKEDEVSILCLSIKEKNEINCLDIEKYLDIINQLIEKEKGSDEHQYRYLDNERIGLIKKLSELKKN